MKASSNELGVKLMILRCLGVPIKKKSLNMEMR